MPLPPDLSSFSDRDVVRLARQRRDDAYRELVRRYERRVHRSIYRIVHHTERTQDLAQETFVNAFEALDRFRSERDFAPWLLTIARNGARDYVDRRRLDSATSARAVTPGAIDAARVWVSGPGSTPSAAPRTLEIDQALHRALERLTPRERTCVMLHHVERRSHREIARMTRMPLGTVKSHLSRARDKLRRAMGD